MSKKKKPRRNPKRKIMPMEIAEKAICKIAESHYTTPELVRKHIQIGLINGLVSDDPQIRERLRQIPCAGGIPTPEEVIAYYASELAGK